MRRGARSGLGLGAGVLLLAMLGCMKDADLPESTRGGGLVLNELLASNGDGATDELGEHDDWVEIHNPTATALPLDGLALSDDPADPAKFVVSGTDSLLPPGGFVVIWCDDGTPPGPFHAGFKLSASGETLLLSDAAGHPLDEVVFGPQEQDHPEGRWPDGDGPWQGLAQATPGGPNQEDAIPMPGRLVINEFLASNDHCCADGNGEYDDWLELHNPGGEPVPLDGLYLSDDAGDPLKARLPLDGGLSLAPGAYLVLWCDGQSAQGPTHLPFALGAGGEDIVVTAADGVEVLDELSYPAQQSDVSRGRLPDGGTQWQDFPEPTPGASNQP